MGAKRRRTLWKGDEGGAGGLRSRGRKQRGGGGAGHLPADPAGHDRAPGEPGRERCGLGVHGELYGKARGAAGGAGARLFGAWVEEDQKRPLRGGKKREERGS